MPFYIALALLVAPQAVLSQALPIVPITIDGVTAKQHLVKQVPPDYPPIARAAHVYGSVQIWIEVDTNGRVVKAKSVSGPPMLVGAAMDSVRDWIYTPFESGGQPVPADTTVTVDFPLWKMPTEKELKILDAYTPLAEACQKAMKKDAPLDQQVDACKKAADAADNFPPALQFVERRIAFEDAARVFGKNKQWKESFVYANKAVAVVDLGQDSKVGVSSAYATRAQAEVELGDLASTDRDLTTAEDCQRRAIEQAKKIDPRAVKNSYIPRLIMLLNFHAKVLTAMDNKAGAEIKLAEAAKL